jgi:nicotinamidase-related amidase
METLTTAGISHVILAGMMTHMCVDATTRAAFDLGFQCTLAHDACATRSLSFGETLVPAHQVHAAFVAALHGLVADARAARDVARSL